MVRTCFAQKRSFQILSGSHVSSGTKAQTVLSGAASAVFVAIGLKIRELRHKLELTGPELAKQANISKGLLSRIENGKIEASLGTLAALARALNVSTTTLLANCREKHDCLFVPSGAGELVSGRGIRVGQQYLRLGHANSGKMSIEPYFITLSAEERPTTHFRHAGVEFIYVLAGHLAYRIADKTYALAPGDSLLFDAADFHGPQELADPPISLLSIVIHNHG